MPVEFKIDRDRRLPRPQQSGHTFLRMPSAARVCAPHLCVTRLHIGCTQRTSAPLLRVVTPIATQTRVRAQNDFFNMLAYLMFALVRVCCVGAHCVLHALETTVCALFHLFNCDDDAHESAPCTPDASTRYHTFVSSIPSRASHPRHHSPHAVHRRRRRCDMRVALWICTAMPLLVSGTRSRLYFEALFQYT